MLVQSLTQGAFPVVSIAKQVLQQHMQILFFVWCLFNYVTEEYFLDTFGLFQSVTSTFVLQLHYLIIIQGTVLWITCDYCEFREYVLYSFPSHMISARNQFILPDKIMASFLCEKKSNETDSETSNSINSINGHFFEGRHTSAVRFVAPINPRQQSSWGQHGAHLGPVGPRWAPCWPHGPCYQGYDKYGPLFMRNVNLPLCAGYL